MLHVFKNKWSSPMISSFENGLEVRTLNESCILFLSVSVLKWGEHLSPASHNKVMRFVFYEPNEIACPRLVQ